MPDSPKKIDSSKKWEKYVNQLATVHYQLQGEEYQPIPDRTQGDAGLEGYSTSGDGIQAFRDEARNASERTKAQKKKISDDLGKLVVNKDFWEGIFSPTGILLKRWYLIVPECDNKEVIKQAQKKAKEIRLKKLSFIHNTFNAFVKTADEHFVQAKAQLDNLKINYIDLQDGEVTEEMLSSLREDKPIFIRNTERKLRQVFSVSENGLIKRCNEYLGLYLESENIISQLEEQAPSIWENLAEYRSYKAKSIEIEGNLTDEKPKKRVKDTRREITNDMEKEFKILSPSTIEKISWGTVSMWIGECPLNF